MKWKAHSRDYLEHVLCSGSKYTSALGVILFTSKDARQRVKFPQASLQKEKPKETGRRLTDRTIGKYLCSQSLELSTEAQGNEVIGEGEPEPEPEQERPSDGDG